MSLAILVPMLGRPHHVAPLLASIYATTPDAHIVFATTPDDTVVRDVIDAAGQERIDVDYASGDYARKINTAATHTTADHLFLAASDLRFHPGWYEACLARLVEGIGVVGTNDLCNQRTATGHSTHSLVTRAYADRGLIDGTPGILYEGYHHNYCDDELVGTARRRGAYAHAAGAMVEHFHPMAGKAPMDETYQLAQSRFRQDRELFRRRCRAFRLR